MVSSVNGALSAQVLRLLGVSGKGLSGSIAALSSGNRITSASTDIAALSIASGLQSGLSGLRSASGNIAQASSFLQVADGGIQQSQAILDRLSALSVQANSGALSKSARAGLNTEFQQLKQELDQISGNTNFNGVNLLDGTLAASNNLVTTSAKGAQAQGSLSFGVNPTAGQTIKLNGVTLTAGVNFATSGTATGTVANLAASLNSNAAFSGYSFSATGTSLNIVAKAAGSAGNNFVIDQAGSTASFITNGNALTGAGVYSLSGGTNAGVTSGDTTASGTAADPLLIGGTGNAASVTAAFSKTSDIVAGNTLSIDNGEGGFTTFNFVAGAPVVATDIQIGSSLQETLDNAANTINHFSGAGDFGTRQLNATVDASTNTLKLSGKVNGNVNDVTGAAIDIALGTAGGSLSGTKLNNGTQGGIDVSNVTNSAFTGSLQGFTATYSGANQLTASVKVGSATYTAQIGNTVPGANSTVRFTSASGGFFDVTLAGGQGVAVANQTDADSFASRLNAATAGYSINQTRDVTSFTGQNPLIGSSLSISGQNFNGLSVGGLTVKSGSAPSISFVVNGETYKSTSALGTSVGAGEQVRLVSASNPGKVITFTNGSTKFDLTNKTSATQLETALKENVGLPGSGAYFQVGNGASDTVQFKIGDLSSYALFKGKSPDLLSAKNAASALGTVRDAQDYLTSQRASVGSYASAVDYTGASIASAIQNQDAARANLTDTDYAAQSSIYALLSVQQSAQIAGLVQGNRLQGNMLQLLIR